MFIPELFIPVPNPQNVCSFGILVKPLGPILWWSQMKKVKGVRSYKIVTGMESTAQGIRSIMLISMYGARWELELSGDHL